MKKTLLALLARSLLWLGRRFIMLVPKRDRLYVKTAGRAMFQVSAVARGFMFGQDFRASDGTGQADRPHAAPEAQPSNPLETYFDSHGEGPGIWKWRHYFQIYHRHFEKFIGREVHILEVGVYSGGSLQMWQSYFGSKCHVYGVDIHEACRLYEGEAVKILVGDQADRGFWRRFKQEVPTLDIVIDDGGHMTEQQVVTLEELLSHLRPGGVYLCEDVYAVLNRFHDYVSGLTHHLNAWDHPPGERSVSLPSPFQRMVRSVHLYPFVVVIEKTDASVGEFVAEKHGTQWQPWRC